MRGLELYELGNDDLIVNVTEFEDLSTVTDELAKSWTWDLVTGPEVLTDEEGEATEWLTLVGVSPVLTGAQPAA